jgi:hypothetical protein
MPAGEDVRDSNNWEIEIVLVAMPSLCIATAKQVHWIAWVTGTLAMHIHAWVAERAFWNAVPVRVEGKTKCHAPIHLSFAAVVYRYWNWLSFSGVQTLKIMIEFFEGA